MGFFSSLGSICSGVGETTTASATNSQSKTDLYKNIATLLRKIAGNDDSNTKASKNNSDNIKNAIDEKYKLQPSEEFWKFSGKKFEEGKLNESEIHSMTKTESDNEKFNTLIKRDLNE